METPSREFGGVAWSGLVVEARSVPENIEDRALGDAVIRQAG
jgi:hypothetical protein